MGKMMFEGGNLMRELDFWKHLGGTPEPYPSVEDVREAIRKNNRDAMVRWLTLPYNSEHREAMELVHNTVHVYGKK